ncbi:universal stress protein [Geobacter sp. AOG2]|uniref:universal stress protein n=1 Tax=Geobacter sp. AOG2 TaxID=1566347 RepID=UPI001CC5F946|nr:universal stress protein [Geobacter sp. AOG2]GFE62764.1 universal stress protein [Geobacter sp. AOG2]
MEDFKRILVVSRMTMYCREAVHYGISLARKYNAELSILHVVHNPFGIEGWNLPIVSLEAEYQKLFEEAKADLDRIIREEKAKGFPIRELIKSGDPTEEVLKTVKDEKIDLLILLAHEEGRIEHFLFGRSNEELIRRMPCSIMLVKKEPKAIHW